MHNKYLWVLICVIGGLALFVELFLLSSTIDYFPLHPTVGDLGNHIAKLYFLDTFGFHKYNPLWYHGITTFRFYPPGWSYFTIPLYWMTNNLLLATYLGLIMAFIVGFFGVLFLGRIAGLSWIKTLSLYLLIFSSYHLINFVLGLGRYPELLSWMLFIFLFGIVWYYKDRKVTWGFFWSIPVFSLMLLTHSYPVVVSCLLYLSLLLTREEIKEYVIIIISFLVPFFITFFWWKGLFFLLNQQNGHLYGAGQELIDPRTVISSNTIIIIGFCVAMFLYLRTFSDNKEKYFSAPFILTAFLLLSRNIAMIPVFNQLPVNSYNIFFLILTVFYFIKVSQKKYKTIIPIILLLGIISSSLYSFYFITPELSYTDLDKQFIELIPNSNGRVWIDNETQDAYHDKLNAFAASMYNKTVSSGHDTDTPSQNVVMINNIKYKYLEALQKSRDDLRNRDCELFTEDIHALEADEIITYDEPCKFLVDCGFTIKERTKDLCLMVIK
ncbi:MAG: 6-pyruvoyl-tetrahydropterin synthase-related protein [Nanoarchaeota archaeon]